MSKRSYRQNCALARAADLIGERWTLLLLRDLLVSPQRFKELLTSLKGIGTNLLAARLKDLEAAGLVERADNAAGAAAYALTERGQALEPAVLALIRWGLSHGPPNQDGHHHRDDWDLLALKALFQPARAGGLDICVQYDTEGFTGWTRIRDGQMSIGTGSAAAADLQVEATVSDLFVGAARPAELVRRGDPEQLARYMAAFALRA